VLNVLATPAKPVRRLKPEPNGWYVTGQASRWTKSPHQRRATPHLQRKGCRVMQRPQEQGPGARSNQMISANDQVDSIVASPVPSISNATAFNGGAA